MPVAAAADVFAFGCAVGTSLKFMQHGASGRPAVLSDSQRYKIFGSLMLDLKRSTPPSSKVVVVVAVAVAGATTVVVNVAYVVTPAIP